MTLYRMYTISDNGTLLYEPEPGESIGETSEVMVAIANESVESVTATFNDIELIAHPGDHPQAIASSYSAECDRLYREYVASAEDANQPDALEDALLLSPEHLTLKNEAGWQKSSKANHDRYGDAVIAYAERWARLMEGRIARGETVEGCAEAASRMADREDITAFMYDCAESILSRVWIHGEELHRWHALT